MDTQEDQVSMLNKTKAPLKLTILTTLLTLSGNVAFAADPFSDPRSLSGIAGVFASAVNTLFWVSGSVFVVMLFVSATKYALTQGDPKGLDGAKQALTYAVFGFLIAISFFAITTITVRSLGLDEKVLTPGKALEAGLEDLKEMLESGNPYNSSYTAPSSSTSLPSGSNVNIHQGNQSSPEAINYGGYGNPNDPEDWFNVPTGHHGSTQQ